MKNDKDLENLFSETCYCLDNILQRPYEWEKERVSSFIGDILNNDLKREDGGSIRCNIGDIISYVDEKDRKLKIIFDGQQRLTTLTLFFSNLYNHLSNDKNYETIKTSIYDVLFTTKRVNGISSTVRRVKLRENDDIVLEKIINNNFVGLTKEERKNFLVKNYNFISKEFTENKNDEELQELYLNIINKSSYFERECESRQEGIRQFNNLNGGQQTLKRSRINISILYAYYKDMNITNQCYENLLCELSNMKDEESKLFYGLFFYYKKLKFSATEIVKPMQNAIKNKSYNVLDSIYNFYVFYKKITNCNFENEELNKLCSNNFIENTSLLCAFIDLFSDKNDFLKNTSIKEKIDTYKKIEYGFISNTIDFDKYGSLGYHLIEGLLPKSDTIYDNLVDYVVGKLKDKKCYANIEILRLLNFEKCNNANKFITNLLLRVEEEYSNELNIKESIIHMSKVSAEHIHPQKKDKKKIYICSDNCTYNLGNYTLMGIEGNISNSNHTYKEKRESYRISPYYINREHLCNYEEWTDDTVKENVDFYINKIKQYYSL